ncbi:glucan 1,4-alpha-glucosidase SCDLUD_002745 [Saccharomycodes ludwigii]|uniref:glucan 1,4-alpha-glucosidase n=1 Tax=Saccharomycodes ludwigii TaxID=36035 RepID=UPI001E87D82E|nr:hypothetical protein SCDLUD_002745 [Saccharomycodes ludwigii]KAH3901256.1 hypothetical protein SCDLUD_002745 [Saccharomycodes ludwigii]
MPAYTPIRFKTKNALNSFYANHSLQYEKKVTPFLFYKKILLFLSSFIIIAVCYFSIQTTKNSHYSTDIYNLHPNKTTTNESLSATHGFTTQLIINDFFSNDNTVNTNIPSFSLQAVNPTATELIKSIKLKTIIHSTKLNRANFNIWIKEQTEICFENMLSNIGDANLHNELSMPSDKISEGIVIASPSKEDPDYFYHWIRDGAITINSIVTQLYIELTNNNNNNNNNQQQQQQQEKIQQAPFNLTLAGTIVKYLNNTFYIQRTDNPSGTFTRNLKGLGEPKWNVDDSAFTDKWGRPQNDGPALRAITTLNFLSILRKFNIELDDLLKNLKQENILNTNNLVFSNETELFHQILYYDLKFIGENWYKDTFDLWEEIYAKHFFTSLTQLKAIKQGLKYVLERGDEIDAGSAFANFLQEEYENMLTFVLLDGGFINDNKDYIIETPDILNIRTGLDVAVLLASILTHDAHISNLGAGGTLHPDYIPFDVDDSSILNTLHALVKTMEILYPINHQRVNLNLGVALGRYPEDEYDGLKLSEGNPWFLATSTAAELLYKLIDRYYNLKEDLIIPLSFSDSRLTKFWTLIFELPITNNNADYELVVPYNSPAFNQTMYNLLNYGDSFLDKLREHISDAGNMSEQFNKYTGFLQGASDLTWSYSSFWSSSIWRDYAMGTMN